MNGDENGYQIWVHNVKDKDYQEGTAKSLIIRTNRRVSNV